MTSLAEVEEDSFNSTSYFDSLKLNSSCNKSSSCNNKSWVELMEEEEMEEEYSRSPWMTLDKTEDNAAVPKVDDSDKFPGERENVGTTEVPAVIDCRPASPVFEREPPSPKPELKPPSPVVIKREVESDEELEAAPWEVGETTDVKEDARVKLEPTEAKVKVEDECAQDRTSRPPSRTEEEEEAKDQSPAASLSSLKKSHKRQRHSRSPDGSRKREHLYSDSSHDEKESAGQCSRDQNPAELLFNFESVRKRRHPMKNSDEGSEPNKRGARYWNRDDAAKKQRRNLPYSSRDSSTSSSQDSLDKKKPRQPVEYEKDPVILARRQKQIDYGKNTVGYDNYLQQVPKNSRTRLHPRTPPKYMKYSRRAWDGMVRIWRQQLHLWDAPSEGNTDNIFDGMKDDDKTEDTTSGDEKKDDVSSLPDSVETDPQDVLDIGL